MFVIGHMEVSEVMGVSYSWLVSSSIPGAWGPWAPWPFPRYELRLARLQIHGKPSRRWGDIMGHWKICYSVDIYIYIHILCNNNDNNDNNETMRIFMIIVKLFIINI